MTSHAPVFEAAGVPGGICSSYYLRPGQTERLFARPDDDSAYRFEIGGGHWIFGGDPTIKEMFARLAPMESYARKSSVFFPDSGTYVPYPLQNNLGYLEPSIGRAAVAEMEARGAGGATMNEWLTANFGRTLCDLFFEPFHALYTAGLHTSIAPQDAYKSPIDIREVKSGLERQASAVGYNVRFLYPRDGLNHLALQMAKRADIRFGKRVTRIDPLHHVIEFADGSSIAYERLLSTLPLNRTLELAGLKVSQRSDPYTSVLVLNIGARRGPRCPDDHWIYIAPTKSGFHRVGIYSNVDPTFVPRSDARTMASFYIERAFEGDKPKPSSQDIDAYAKEVVEELRKWGYLDEVDVLDPTWIDVAYTWQWPGSTWVREGMAKLEALKIFPVGRYARWTFQGIADSIRDGLYAGSALKECEA